MIYFLITKDLEYLGSKLDVLHRNYITWNCNLDDFVKKEYANIDAMKIDTMIIEQAALENSHALVNLQNIFSDIKIVCIIRNTSDLPELEKINKIELINYDDNIEDSLRKILNLNKKEEKETENDSGKEPVRIGFLAEKREDAIFPAISFVNALSKKDKRTCFCEISDPKKVILPQIAEKYQLVYTGIKGVYQLGEIPFICNAGKEGMIYTVCSFCEEDHMERLYEQCDLQIWCESNENELLLHCNDKHINLQITNPFIEDHREKFQELLGSQFSFFDKEETETETDELISEIQEEQKREQSRKVKKTIKRAGFFVILLFLMILFGFVISNVFRNIKGRERKETLKKEVQKEKITTQTTTQITTEITTEKRTEDKGVSIKKKAKTSNIEKKRKTPIKKKSKQQRNTSMTTVYESVVTTKQNKKTKPRNSVKDSTKKPKATTQKKRTTTEKKKVTTQQKKVTTEKSKNHTEDFIVDYKVE